MIAQLDNRVMVSFKLWLDNALLTKGQAYTNHASNFYRVKDTFSNVFSYGLPFRQIINDNSIAGATVMTGVYLNGILMGTGVSGFLNIDYDKGYVYFNNPVTGTLSGSYAVKDFNIELTSETEQKILFETKYETRPKVSRDLSGLAPNADTFPIIYLRNDTSYNEPFHFGGVDQTYYQIRAIVLSDDQFKLDALCSILRDRTRTNIPIFSAAELPFNHYGGLKSGYNYANLYNSKLQSPGDVAFLENVRISSYNQKSIVITELKNINSNIFPVIIDCTLCLIRNPHL